MRFSSAVSRMWSEIDNFVDALCYFMSVVIGRRWLFSWQVYRGPDRTYRLTGLTAKSDYQVRVNAVRHTRDDEGAAITLTGPFSANVPFTTPALARSINPKNSGSTDSDSPSYIRSLMSEQTWMFVLILIAFMFFAIVVAFIAKQIVDWWIDRLFAACGQFMSGQCRLSDNVVVMFGFVVTAGDVAAITSHCT